MRSSSRQADFLSMVSTGRDTVKRCCVLYFVGRDVISTWQLKETQWLPSLSAGAANFVQGAGGMSCQGHLGCTDPMFSIGGTNALGNWCLSCWTIWKVALTCE